MSDAALCVVHCESVALLRAGALYWPSQEALVVADLHFEKGSHFATRGVFLPPYDTRTTLRRLANLLATHTPRMVISLGDAFHDGDAEARMDQADAAMLESLIASVRWIWVLGNHDPAPPSRFGGAVVRGLQMGNLVFRHEPSIRPAPGEVAGHLHPAARVRAESRVIRRRCFAADESRIVLPAFGAYAGGLNVRDDAFAPLFDDVTAYVLGGEGVYPFARAALEPDPPSLSRAESVRGCVAPTTR
jgi:hypothetical protein